MIFVVTGFHSTPFDRLISLMDDIASRIQEEVVIQKGTSSIEPRYSKSFKWGTDAEIETLFERARIVVCHAGVGTILDSRRHGKPTIIVPRRRENKEHYDDHQLDIAKAVARLGSVRYTEDVVELERLLKGKEMGFAEHDSHKKKSLIAALRQVVLDVERDGRR